MAAYKRPFYLQLTIYHCMKKIYISKEQIDKIQTLVTDNKSKDSMLLNEENRTQKKKCVENITLFIHPSIRPYLDYELNDLPYSMQQMLNPEGALFKSVSNNQNGANKFIDYLRINLYQQFGIGRNSNLTQFIPGISRIACDDCNFYSFSLAIDGGKIIELNRVLKLIDRKPDYMLDGLSLDSDFNGFSYKEFMSLFKNKLEEYINITKNALNSDEYKVTKTSNYTIIPIKDSVVSRDYMKVLRPTPEGRRVLNQFGRYTDWCVCNNAFADEEYSQYLSNGGKMYICAKEGFEEIKRPTTTNTPLDEYGLSLLCVIIGQDGLPTNVTTRYNHDFGGENHSKMWEATHLQRLLNVNFFDVFKPRNKEELEKLHLAENKVPAAQDQVKKRVNAGIMDAICGGMSEGIHDSKIQKWYRGFNSNFDNLGTRGDAIWVADNPYYAKSYAEEYGEYGKIAEVTIDSDLLKPCSTYDLDDDADFYDLSEDDFTYLRNEGYNSYYLDYYSSDSEGLCIFSKEPIIDVRIFSQEEYDSTVNIDQYLNGEEGDKDIIQESQNDRLVNKLISDRLGLTEFSEIRKFALQVCHAIPNVRFNKCYYLLGVTRLVIDEKLRGRHISELNRILYNIERRGEKLTRDLDGMSFIDLWDEYYDDELISQSESVEKIRKTPTGYIIKHIETFDESYNSGPQDWCITYEEEYYYSLVDAEDCIYIVENPQMMAKINTNSPEFMEKCRKMGDPTVNDLGDYGSGEAPYDDFGLSRFVVTVNPSNIFVYSRWNLTDGLDGDFLNRQELEEVLGMSFEEAFPYIKPKELTDDERAYLYENTEKEVKTTLLNYIEQIAKFMKDDGLNIYPYPEVELDWSEQNGLFITTGYYLPSERKVVLFCKDRHPKDILRSYAHEMIHHMQNLEGKNLNFSNKDDVKDNKELEKLESEAYLKGNIYFRKWTEHEKSKNDVLNESIISVSLLRELTQDLDESLEPDEVDLSSFNIKKNLNPKFWKNDLLDSRIRIKLLDIADDFIEFLGVDWVKPEDITITGSLANYNWNQKHSDIDLHIIMDFSKVDERVDFVENYFQSQKNLWNEEHKDLKIFGFPIEVYVQDINQEHTSNGVYSLEKNEWVIEPSREKLTKVKVNKNRIKKEVSKYTEKIDNLLIAFEKADDDYKISKIYEKAKKLFDEIKKVRRNNLSKSSNEMNEGNIIFKCLRRLGYINKLDDIINKGYNKLNSLP